MQSTSVHGRAGQAQTSGSDASWCCCPHRVAVKVKPQKERLQQKAFAGTGGRLQNKPQRFGAAAENRNSLGVDTPLIRDGAVR